jgi:hypothetical protein
MTDFADLLKRGNLPDDDRSVPNWLKIKNKQFHEVDFSHNVIDNLIMLSSAEFNEFVSSVNHDMLFVYLSTMSDNNMQKFYTYLQDNDTLEPRSQEKSAREQFENTMCQIKADEISDEKKARATLEIPLMINFSKHTYHSIMDFIEYASQDYYNYASEDTFTMYEDHFSEIIWKEMKYIPDHFEQVLDHFQKFYDEKDKEHKKFFAHLSNRFGLLIATLNRLVYMREERDSSFNWFTHKMVEYDLVPDIEISISQSKTLTSDKKLINFLSTTFAGICDQSDDNYLSSLICVVQTLFEWYPTNRVACEYAMLEMMKSVAIKKVNVQNANEFLEFFEKLPRFYDVLSYDKIYELKELINHILANYKPQDNEIFDNPEVKNKLILLNYLVDMEDLYYESFKDSSR